jgi:hypothetical protein
MFNVTEMLQKNRRAVIGVLLFVFTGGLALLIIGSVGYRNHARQYDARQQLNARLARMPQAGDHRANIAELEHVIAEAKELDIHLPEAAYSRLWHKWQLAVQDFKQIIAVLNNRYLAAEQRQQLHTFHERLLALRDDCAAGLETTDSQSMSLRWKLHNLKGNVSVMLAYSVLSFEQDGRKAAKFLSDAVDDYKTSIELVDQACSSSLERSLPRWNMELIVGLGEYRKIGLSEVRQENMSEVQEQLEAFIPEVAGFAPGVPLETRVEK